MVATQFLYSGDVSLEYGGLFIDLSTFSDGYCTAVRITDLDSGCGFTGAVMVEHIVINGTDDSKRIREALKSYGGLNCRNWAFIGRRETIKENARMAIAEALESYGYTDPDDSWNGYQSHHTEILQLEADGPMTFDGWKADKRLHNTDLKQYVESVHLNG